MNNMEECEKRMLWEILEDESLAELNEGFVEEQASEMVHALAHVYEPKDCSNTYQN